MLPSDDGGCKCRRDVFNIEEDDMVCLSIMLGMVGMIVQ